MSTFILQPLPAGAVDVDAPATVQKTAADREPCRRCLRDATPGERLALASYDPFTVRSPYAGEGPVFVHADGCEPFASAPGAISEQVAGPDVAFLHVHFAGPGCFAFRVDRA
jgi:hypothetical protein